MLRALFALAALLGYAVAQDKPVIAPPERAQPESAPTPLKIGTWNIEFLGADPKLRRDAPPRTSEDYQKMGAYIRELGVAALGVQEICGEAPLRKVAAAVGPTWRAVLGTSGQWTDGKTQQGVGFLYDAAQLRLVHCEEFLDFPSKRDDLNVFHRKPVTGCFQHIASGADFRLVVVHMKAGRKDRDRQKRRAEAQTLREWIIELQGTAGEDQDIAILGDFNCTYGDAPEQVLTADGAARYLEHATPGPTIVWFDEPIDQIVAGKAFNELAGQTIRAHRVTGEAERLAYRQSFSDHFACTVTLQLRGDDDHAATFSRGPASQWLPTNRRDTAPSDAATPGWPIPVGTPVTVFLTKHIDMLPRYEGTLAAPLMDTAGWVVITCAGTTHAFSSEHVLLIKPRK